MAKRSGRPGRAYEPKPLDAVDLQILTELQRDGRVSLAELGRRVSLSAPAVAERVQRLEETGVISPATTRPSTRSRSASRSRSWCG